MLEMLSAGSVVVLVGPLFAQMRRMPAWIVQFCAECSVCSNGGVGISRTDWLVSYDNCRYLLTLPSPIIDKEVLTGHYTEPFDFVLTPF